MAVPLALLVGGCGGAEPAQASAPPANAKRVDASVAGIVGGRVTYEGARAGECRQSTLRATPSACASSRPA